MTESQKITRQIANFHNETSLQGATTYKTGLRFFHFILFNLYFNSTKMLI